jgi:hypothetical protein
MASSPTPDSDAERSKALALDAVKDGFGYLELPQERKEGWMAHEGFSEKFMRKTKANPFVPIGLAMTIGALSYGLWQLKTGDRVMSQKMMRLRVAAQGFTLVALLGGVAYQAMQGKRPST